MKKTIITFLMAIMMLLICVSPVLADEGGDVDVDIGISAGGDIDADIGLSAGGDIAVSINGEGLATDTDIANIWSGISGMPGRGGVGDAIASPETHWYIYTRYVIPMRADIANLYSGINLTMDGLAKLILEVADQEVKLDELSEEQLRQYEEISTWQEEIETNRLPELEAKMQDFTQSQLELEHLILIDYTAYRIALAEYNNNIKLGILLLLVIGLATALEVVMFKQGRNKAN